MDTKRFEFEAALARETMVVPAELQKVAADEDYRAPRWERYSYVARGEYASQLERWLARYPREQLHVVVSEEMFADPGKSVAALFEFLGLEPIKLDS